METIVVPSPTTPILPVTSSLFPPTVTETVTFPLLGFSQDVQVPIADMERRRRRRYFGFGRRRRHYC